MAAQLLAGRPLVFQDGSKVSADEHLADKVVLLYFSASWCGPCRHFTPKLKEFYAELKAQGHSQLEVVFVSMDRSAEEQAEYFRDMHGPWARLEFDDPMNKVLAKKLAARGIPSLCLARPEGGDPVALNDAELRGPAERFCDICRDQVGDFWFKCQQCEDYDLCRKCKTHLQLSAEHTIVEVKREEYTRKPAAEIWAEWMAEGTAEAEDMK